MLNLFFTAVLFFLISFHSVPVNSDELRETKSWNYFAYGGQFTATDLMPILFRQSTDYKDSYIAVLGANRETDFRIRFFQFETELNAVKHFGEMNHFEGNGLYSARVKNLFYLPMSFAFGEGLSIASENPRLENKSKGIYFENYQFLIQSKGIESRNILNFIMVELDYGLSKSFYDSKIFMRIHHRSGVFGLLCPPDPACGSNFVSYGIKFTL
ncbi:MAG TPA: hypothetical protein PK453_23445 [Leptospiraceae bacterium]|nr:hypothetical protein [Leptospiraceae bacterium]HMY69516.1 hypothetical protein [Leptospiraceae bacterium]HNF16629.1 hypothetical protein [Leptospiraceae bacterium]HNF24757.1 hypothetical protein [Leptospiraceae bacterium]HNH07061.1 hypothetical protein [Leptospiraceae bacterium]